MAGFQVKNAEGEKLSINQLDESAAAFWGKPVEATSYATPGATLYSTNWYDLIGWNIAHQTNYTKGWANVVHSIFLTYIKYDVLADNKATTNIQIGLDQEKISSNLAMLQPYINLINHWAELGYTPVQVKD